MPDTKLKSTLIPGGYQFAGVAAGIKKKAGELDVGLIVSDKPAAISGAFTQNTVVAAPVVFAKDLVGGGTVRAMLVNSGNANACTGKQGERDVIASQKLLAKKVGCAVGEVMPASTGIIGHPLPMKKLESGIGKAVDALGDGIGDVENFAKAILTTDTTTKVSAVSVSIGGQPVKILGIAKGSGMIAPHMEVMRAARPKHATMLAYILTDAEMPAAALRKLWRDATEETFNRVTVDRDTSTNDTAVLVANGASGAKINDVEATRKFRTGLEKVCTELARKIASDGEGASKLVTVNVTGAISDEAAEKIARGIADSLLVKTALHGNDPNWGRIIAAAGASGGEFDPNLATLKIVKTTVYAKGKPKPFDPKVVSKAMNAKEVALNLACGQEEGAATVWTCDLSKDYITINAEYST
ncbi:MAG: bifunctional glutamate N-acetyltransferase/amino-acid acetyltransferase ArgJ [Planctomycetota bacterium]